MAVVHIAVFRWKPEADLAAVVEALRKIQGVADDIPEIIEICVARNLSKYDEGYTHVVLVRGESQDAIDAYRNHPDHVVAAAVIEAAEEHGIGVDFDAETPLEA